MEGQATAGRRILLQDRISNASLGHTARLLLFVTSRSSTMGSVSPSSLMDIFNLLKACCSPSCNYIMAYEGTFSSLASEVGQLKDKSSDVKRDVEAATRDGQTPRSEVLGWLSSVQDMEGEAESIERKYNQKIKCLCSFPLNVCSAYRLRNRAEAALATIRELKQSAEFTKLADNLNLTRSIKMPTTKTIGMEKVFEELLCHAKDDSLSVIGIHGMGGVGKTALLRRFNNDFPSETEADVVIFLELSIDYKLEEVQKSLFERLSLTWQDEVTHRDRATKLFRVLSTLKFILLFDNLWEPLNYQVVGIPLPAPPSKCKIIFTTRTEDTCSHMGTEKMIKMECLEEEAAWNLFRNSARMDVIDADKNILIKARDLVKECGGLPAALIVLAQAMAPKKTWEEWIHALTIMKDTPHQLPGEGIIDNADNIGDSTRKTQFLLGILHAASLIERVHDNYFRIHPMTRAMILWVQRECGKKENKWLVPDRDRVEEAPAAEKWRDAERIALVWNQIRDLPEAPQCPNMIFLNLHVNKFLRKIPNGFFLHMPHLKILDLQETSIEELPVSIGNLMQLHFLELSRTRITSLPKEMAALVNLKYLSLESMKYLRTIPDRLISGLRELQWLNMVDSYSGWREGGVSFEELESLKRLKVIGITVSTLAALQNLCDSPRLAAVTHWLHIEGCQDLTMFNIPSTDFHAETMLRLIRIQLHAMSELEEVVIGNRQPILLPLQEFRLSSLPKAKLVWRATFPNALRELKIEDCGAIDRLIKLEGEANGGGETVITIFPDLHTMVLRRLPELKSLSDGERILNFPSLKTIKVEDCPKLMKLTLVADGLKEIECERSWWEQLNWGDERSKSFEHLYNPMYID
ncbi:disease resistance protein RPS2-like isoform X2 [Zingiber officinale]|uniref:disease resistance protein RPS2-like isoform X2 n=1 Tax=Zingiber officinale TaxID=94328 RepID=UPI001C4BE137|nr:disease resistance protein RPS2-like isoform X2 [Zingiber officinale]